MPRLKFGNTKESRLIEQLLAENEELKAQLAEQSDALCELAELIEGGEEDG